jgi:hypothetical protein
MAEDGNRFGNSCSLDTSGIESSASLAMGYLVACSAHVWQYRGGLAMNQHLEAVTLAVASGIPEMIHPNVRWAYEDGATLTQVLMAIDAAGCIALVPRRLRTKAWAAAHQWAWIRRRTTPAYSTALLN